MKKYLFRNDYSFGAHPKVLEAVCAVNLEGNHGYGDDGYTARAKERIREVCGCPDAMVEFLIGGTQTNVVACSFLLKPWEAAICPDSGHLNGHEVGAFEATGHKILPVPVGGDGKITPEMLPPLLALHQDPHLTKPGLVYISNATENGAVYTKAELTALYAFCRENGLLLFVDGARLGAALTSKANDLTLPEFAHLCDAFYIGGTKNGAMFGEALVITRPELTDGFFRMKKRMGAVMEKGWIQGVMFQALFTDDLYFHMARHANEMAARLQNGLRAKGWTLWVDSPTNQVFAVVDNALKPQLDAVCDYEDWCPYDGSRTVVRVLAGRGAREDVEELTADVFLALWAHAGELDPEQGLRPWLGAVARNRAMDWLRTHKEAAPLPEDAAAPGGADPQAEAERREWAARLWDAVEGLDEPDRTLFLRYYYCGDKLKDIARALGLTQTAAKQRLFRGRKALRDTLTKGGVEA